MGIYLLGEIRTKSPPPPKKKERKKVEGDRKKNNGRKNKTKIEEEGKHS